MNMRKITSLTALISFILLLITSVVLYIVPAGRVAYWADWQLWGLSKEQWGAVHINLGVLLLLTMVLHVYYNWQPLVSYLNNKSKQLRVFTPDFFVATGITLVFFFGTLANIPPFSSVIHLGTSITENANQKFGEPPYGHAELSPLTDFVSKINVPLDGSLLKLEQAGISVESNNQTIKDIAQQNNVSPQTIYLLIKPAQVDTLSGMPEQAPGGTGNRTLEQICALYQLDITKIVEGLAAKGITATPKQTMREIAVAHETDPSGVYALIYSLATE